MTRARQSTVEEDLAKLEILFRARTLRQSYGQIAAVTGLTRSAVSGVVKRGLDAGPVLAATPVTDRVMLHVLDALFRDGRPLSAVARDLARWGLSVPCAALVLLVWYVLHDTALAGEDPECRDRLHWPVWWRPLPEAAEAAA